MLPLLVTVIVIALLVTPMGWPGGRLAVVGGFVLEKSKFAGDMVRFTPCRRMLTRPSVLSAVATSSLPSALKSATTSAAGPWPALTESRVENGDPGAAASTPVPTGGEAPLDCPRRMVTPLLP